MLRSAGSRSFHKTAGLPCVRRGRKTCAKFTRKACAVRNISNKSKKKPGRSCNLFSPGMTIDYLAEKGGSRTLREPYGPQTGFEDQRHHRAPSFSVNEINYLWRAGLFSFLIRFLKSNPVAN